MKNESKIRPIYKGEAQVKRLNLEINSEFVNMSCDRNDCEGTVSFRMSEHKGQHFSKCSHCPTFYKLDGVARYHITTDWGTPVAEVEVEL